MNKFKLACDPNTPPEILDLMATDEDWWIRYQVAQNPNTPPGILRCLATDEKRLVRICVGRSPNATEIDRRLVLMTNHKSSKS